MKLSRNAVRRKTHALPTLRFEQQRLTSFSGLLLFQVLFGRLGLKRRLRPCFETGAAIYQQATIVLSLIVHLLLGYYYPLICTVAQTGQVFDLLHRPGNVHDSRGAKTFIVACIELVRAVLPGVVLEVRLDSAFFSDEIVRTLHELGVEFSISVPFGRFVELKQRIERRRLWYRANDELSYFEDRWKPKSWPRRYRFVYLRTAYRRRSSQPVQLDLFEPVATELRYTVVVTNKTIKAAAVVRFHHGRGAQEAVFAELKSQGQLDYIPTRTLAGNQLFLLAAVLAYNLNRELQMTVEQPDRTTTPTRAPLWSFQKLETVRRTLIQRAGRLTRPQGELTLTVSANAQVRDELLHCLDQLQKAA